MSLRAFIGLGLLAAGLAAGCNRGPGGEDTGSTATWTTDWTPERIAADPAGYLAYAGTRVEDQIRGREERLAAIEARKAEIAQKAAGVKARFADAKNVNERLAAAARRADDEDGWPLKFAGRTFDKAKADAVLAATQTYLTDIEPLVQAYENALARLDGATAQLNNDILKLRRMGEKIGLDLERVRLNQGVAELTELRKTEAELSAFSATLADMSGDLTLDELSTVNTKSEQVDVESLLK